MDDYGRLAALAALKSSVCEQYDEVRERCDREAVRTGTRSRRVSIGGQPVATYTMAWAEGPRVVDPEAFGPWAAQNCMATERAEIDLERLGAADRAALVSTVAAHWPEAVVRTYAPDKGWERWVQDGGGGKCVTVDGELVPGCVWVSEPKYSKVTDCAKSNRKLDVGKVARAMAAAQMDEIAGLIDGSTFADEPDMEEADDAGNQQ